MHKRTLILFSVGYACLLASPNINAEEPVKCSIVLGDEAYDEDDSDDEECCYQRRFSLFSNDCADDDCWYDDTGGWPGFREDTWERDLQH